MNKIERIKELIAALQNVTESDDYTMESYCLDRERNKLDSVSELSIEYSKYLAIMLIAGSITSLAKDILGKYELGTVTNISDKLVKVYGVRCVVYPRDCKSASRDWEYSSARNLLPDDTLSIWIE